MSSNGSGGFNGYYAAPYDLSFNQDSVSFYNIEQFQITGTVANDFIDIGNNTNKVVVNGGAGIDTLSNGDFSSATSAITLNELGTATISLANGTSISNIERFYNVALGSGNDTVNFTNRFNNGYIYTGAGNDTINAGLGQDTVDGEDGNDLLIIDYSSNTYTGTSPQAGIFSGVYSNGSGGFNGYYYAYYDVSGNYDQVSFYNIEQFQITGTGAADTIYTGDNNDTLDGLGGNDALNGLGGNDTLNGGTGNDTLTGGLGDDFYIVDSTTDKVIENLNEGIDTVQSSVTYTLSNNVENLVLTGAIGISGTGNILNNTITGNSANNTLNGGVGADNLIGGTGNDTYSVDDGGDVVTENANAGTDTVQASINYILGNNVEKLTLLGITNLNGTGNELNNTLTGNTGNNTLIGLGGNDTIDGKIGADSMQGGLGNDTYTIDNVGDVVTENLNEGTDTVKTSLDYTLGANLENLTLSGTANLNGTGNALNNTLTGNAGVNTLIGLDGNDILDGKVGVDTMIGGLGNDTYTVDNVGDVVTENLNEGTDAVKTNIDYILGSNLENLTLLLTTNLNGTGNALNNTLTGNTGANILNGGVGTDTLAGKGGADTFVFRFGESTVTALDRVSDFAIGTDKIDLLTQGGAAMNAPIAFTRAADSATTILNTIVTNVFADANGAVAGSQALAINEAVLVKASTATYLIINDGTAGFQSANDLVVNLTGITGTLPALGSIPVNSFFA
jgi:Ca2+-binding RTX toxin-like protein